MKKKYYSLSLIFLFVVFGMLNSITIIASAKNTGIYMGEKECTSGIIMERQTSNDDPSITLKSHSKCYALYLDESIDLSPAAKESNSTTEAIPVEDSSAEDVNTIKDKPETKIFVIIIIIFVIEILSNLIVSLFYKLRVNREIEVNIYWSPFFWLIMLVACLGIYGFIIIIIILAALGAYSQEIMNAIYNHFPFLCGHDTLLYTVVAVAAFGIDSIICSLIIFASNRKLINDPNENRQLKKKNSSHTYPARTNNSVQNKPTKNSRPIKDEIAEKRRKQAEKAYKYYDKWYNAKLNDANALTQINNTAIKDDDRMRKAVQVLLQNDFANNEIETLNDRTIVSSLKRIFNDGGIELSYLYSEFKKNGKTKEAMLIIAASAKLGNNNAMNENLYKEYKEIRIKKLCFELESLFNKMNSNNESDNTIIDAIIGYGDGSELFNAAQKFNSIDKKDEALLTVAASYKLGKGQNTRNSALYKEYNIRRLYNVVLSLDKDYKNYDVDKLTEFSREGNKDEFYDLACRFEKEGKFTAAIFTYAVSAAAGSRKAAYTLSNMAMEDTRYFISFDTDY